MGATFSTPKKRSKGGRPTKRTPAVTQKIIDGLSMGLSDEQAASYAGISDVSLTIWKRDPEFLEQIQRAVNERLYKRLARIEAGENWQGCGWLLERLYPTRWAKPEIQLAINTTNQTINNTALVITAEVAGAISSRVREVDARIERLLRDRRGGNGNGHAPARTVEVEAQVEVDEKFSREKRSLPLITMPEGDPGSGWWRQLTAGSGEREIERTAAEKVCRLIVQDVLGRQRAQQAQIRFDASTPVLLRDVHQAIESICGSHGWTALRKRGES